MLSVILAVGISVTLCYIVYFTRKDSKYFKYISMAGYMVVYALAVFGSKNDNVFVMLFPITCIFILYFYYKIILTIAMVYGAINILDVCYDSNSTNIENINKEKSTKLLEDVLQVHSMR